MVRIRKDENQFVDVTGAILHIKNSSIELFKPLPDWKLKQLKEIGIKPKHRNSKFLKINQNDYDVFEI